MKNRQPSHEDEIGHFPSDIFYGIGDDDGTKKEIDPNSYLYDEGDGILIHNYGLFDQDECAAGELWDLADGKVFAEGSSVTQDFIAMDGMIVIEELPADISKPDDADKWLAENDK